MKTGFENEYFVARPDGTFLQTVPYDLPDDAAGTLVEARSKPFEDPFDTLSSFEAARLALEAAVTAKGLVMKCLATCPTVIWNGAPETAGFHIHFSNDTWRGLPASHHTSNWRNLHDAPPKEIAEMLRDLDRVFKPLYTGVVRHRDAWRPKSWGWEYRRLPATVDPHIVAKRLAELYYPASAAAALTVPRKKAG